MRVPQEAVVRVPQEAVVRVPQEADVRVPQEAVVRVPQEAVVRIPQEAVVRVPQEAAERVPQEAPMIVPQESVVRVPQEAVVRVPQEAWGMRSRLYKHVPRNCIKCSIYVVYYSTSTYYFGHLFSNNLSWCRAEVVSVEFYQYSQLRFISSSLNHSIVD